jgi:hypothetical protein
VLVGAQVGGVDLSSKSERHLVAELLGVAKANCALLVQRSLIKQPQPTYRTNIRDVLSGPQASHIGGACGGMENNAEVSEKREPTLTKEVASVLYLTTNPYYQGG